MLKQIPAALGLLLFAGTVGLSAQATTTDPVKAQQKAAKAEQHAIKHETKALKHEAKVVRENRKAMKHRKHVRRHVVTTTTSTGRH